MLHGKFFFLFTLDALLICSSHYTQLMSFSWTNACNFTRNITSTACNNMRVITRIFLYLCVWCMDTAWTLCGHCMDAACNVRVVHALYAHVMLQSLWPVLYTASRQQFLNTLNPALKITHELRFKKSAIRSSRPRRFSSHASDFSLSLIQWGTAHTSCLLEFFQVLCFVLHKFNAPVKVHTVKNI